MKVAILGAMRIPFARANGAYNEASNQDMLTAAMRALVERFGLKGEKLGEVAGGAVIKHSRARFQSRECLITAPAATSPTFSPLRAKRSTSARIAAVSMSWLLASL